ncbi:MAG: DUF763 domain-containing protein [Candidatus Micrarchaeia archaeon]
MHYATTLPLHGGKAPRWLYGRMVKLGRAISVAIMDNYGADELVRRLSDPNWFQALACAIGYDWHSSGTTTVTIGALKEALNDTKEIYIAGGKGKSGTNTPNDIEEGVDALSIPQNAEEFKQTSRLAAKIDSSMIYDNIGIYHHSFIFTRNKWAVVQQAMEQKGGNAIRFQWFSDYIDKRDVANEPHSAISSRTHKVSLDLTYVENKWAREASLDALEEYSNIVTKSYPQRHALLYNVDVSAAARKAIIRASEAEPKDYRELLLVKGVGRSTLRSLAFVASLIFGKELAYRDPAAFAYNLGGKDGIPFPVQRSTYDKVIESMNYIIDASNIDRQEKLEAMKRLSAFFES